MNSNAIKAIYACRRQVQGLEEEENWRSFLQNLIGKRSLREMSERELHEVLDELRRNGAAPRAGSNKPYIRKVFAIWGDMCREKIPNVPTKEGLRAFVHNMVGVDDPNWLTLEQARKVTEGLKAWRAREERKREQEEAGA